MKFYTLRIYLPNNNSSFCMASKRGAKWYVGGAFEEKIPSNEYRLTLQEARNAKKAICKWDNFTECRLEIMEIAVSINEKIVE